MTAMLLSPLVLRAQYDENRYGIQSWGKTGLMGKQGSGDSYDITNDITNDNFETTPIGSGIAILIGAGLGYAALKKKEDKQ